MACNQKNTLLAMMALSSKLVSTLHFKCFFSKQLQSLAPFSLSLSLEQAGTSGEHDSETTCERTCEKTIVVITNLFRNLKRVDQRTRDVWASLTSGSDCKNSFDGLT